MTNNVNWINLAHNQITDDSAFELIKSLFSLLGIRGINLAHNQISDASAFELIENLRSQPNVVEPKYLNLSILPVSDTSNTGQSARIFSDLLNSIDVDHDPHGFNYNKHFSVAINLFAQVNSVAVNFNPPNSLLPNARRLEYRKHLKKAIQLLQQVFYLNKPFVKALLSDQDFQHLATAFFSDWRAIKPTVALQSNSIALREGEDGVEEKKGEKEITRINSHTEASMNAYVYFRLSPTVKERASVQDKAPQKIT